MHTLDAQLQHLGLKPIRGGYGPATADELLQLEAQLGHALPADYEDFLRRYGYARFQNVVAVALPGGEHEAPIAVFFGGTTSGEPINRQIEDYADALPHGMLPIARDPFGNLFLLDVGSERPGRIWYANFEQDYETVPVADSFEDLLGRCQVTLDDDE